MVGEGQKSTSKVLVMMQPCGLKSLAGYATGIPGQISAEGEEELENRGHRAVTKGGLVAGSEVVEEDAKQCDEALKRW